MVIPLLENLPPESQLQRLSDRFPQEQMDWQARIQAILMTPDLDYALAEVLRLTYSRAMFSNRAFGNGCRDNRLILSVDQRNGAADINRIRSRALRPVYQ